MSRMSSCHAPNDRAALNDRARRPATAHPAGEGSLARPGRARRPLVTSLAGLLLGTLVAFALYGCGAAAEEIRRAEQAEFHYKLANNYFYDRNMVMAMREGYTALEHDPDHPDTHHLLGFIMFGRKQYADAIMHFQKAIAGRDKFYDAIANLGAVFLAQKRWEEAIEQYEQLTREQLYPTPDLAHANLGWALFNLKRYGEAREQYRLALFLNPQLCLAYNNLGLLYEATGDYGEAIESLERAAEQCSKYAEPHFHLGRLFLKTGRHGDASRAFSRCHELEPKTSLGRRCEARKF